jgi:hypothetical protein
MACKIGRRDRDRDRRSAGLFKNKLCKKFVDIYIKKENQQHSLEACCRFRKNTDKIRERVHLCGRGEPATEVSFGLPPFELRLATLLPFKQKNEFIIVRLI